jgi:hypothetical protein
MWPALLGSCGNGTSFNIREFFRHFNEICILDKISSEFVSEFAAIVVNGPNSSAIGSVIQEETFNLLVDGYGPFTD